jgi:hypothetical protein
MEEIGKSVPFVLNFGEINLDIERLDGGDKPFHPCLSAFIRG